VQCSHAREESSLARALPTSRTPHDRVPLFARVICLGVILGAAYPASLPAEQDDLGNVVFSLTEAIIDSTKASTTKPTVRVQDFQGPRGDASQLDIELANQVSDLLRQASSTSVHDFFLVLGRLAGASSVDEQPCDSEHPWPDILVNGDMDEVDGRLVLRLRANWAGRTQFIFDRRISLPMDSAKEALLAKRLPPVGESQIWVRQGYVTSDERESMAAQVYQKADDFTPPRCIRCQRTAYTDGASLAKVQGTITMMMLLSRDGDPLKLVVLQGLPCGLNQAAMKSVATWQLTPAKAAYGTPVEIWQEVELTFQLF
jgi:Gram-negative bacterial TonB protein C-terminal